MCMYVDMTTMTELGVETKDIHWSFQMDYDNLSKMIIISWYHDMDFTIPWYGLP